MQEPTLQASHFITGDHEAAVPARDPAASRMGKHQRIPAGAVGRCQQHRTVVRQVLPAQDRQTAAKEALQGDVLGEHHRHGRQPGVDAVAETLLTRCEGHRCRA